jgi:heat shock protein HspQ
MPSKAPKATRSRRKKTAPKQGVRNAKFALGQVVRHRVYAFRGVVFDIDPVFNNTEDWWLAIPAEIRPVKDQPFYHLLAENAETEYIAYVSEQNLLPDESGEPLRHPQIGDYFVEEEDGRYRAVFIQPH